MPVTINDVANHAGVSKKTVSRVLNSEAHVREATRNIVLDSIAQLEYSPNISARRLANQRSRAIGLVGPGTSDYFSGILSASVQIGDERGYSQFIAFHNPDNRKTREKILGLVTQKQIDGLMLVAPSNKDNTLLKRLNTLQSPFVLFAPSIVPTPFPFVAINDQDGTYKMTEYLISMGHRRIGYVKGDVDHGPSDERFRGYQAALEAFQIPLNPAWVRTGEYMFKKGVLAGKQLLTLVNRPTAILASNDESAAGILAVANQMEIRIPEKLSVAGFDDAPIATKVSPQLTTVHQPINSMTRQALDILIGLIEGKSPEKRQIIFPVELVVRKSTGPWKS